MRKASSIALQNMLLLADMPPPMYAARCRPAPAHTRLTPGLRRPVAVGAMNIHDVRDRQTDVRRASSLNAP